MKRCITVVIELEGGTDLPEDIKLGHECLNGKCVAMAMGNEVGEGYTAQEQMRMLNSMYPEIAQEVEDATC